MMGYDPEIEFLSKEDLVAVQTENLRKHLQFCYENSPYYRNLLKDFAGRFETFTLQDITALPFTCKDDISTETSRFVACREDEVRDIVFSSGSTGEPCRFVYTGHDVERNTYNEERCYRAANVAGGNKILLTCTMDRCFIAGVAYYLGGMKAGASVLRNGLASVESHLWIIKKEKPDVLVGIASFLVKLAEYAAAEKVSLSHVRTLVCVGEPVKDENLELNGIGKRLQSHYPDAELFATYDSTEIATSFSECPEHCGGHIPGDLAYVEIVDDDGNVLPDGEAGEVVVTPFNVTGMPLVRYRTGDVSFKISEPCRCGRNTPRLGPILGRKKHLLKYKGTSIYPQVIFNTLMAIPEVDNYYIIVEGSDLSDRIKVVVSLKSSEISSADIQDKLLVCCRARLPIEIKSIEEVAQKVFGSNRKPQHFFDCRN